MNLQIAKQKFKSKKFNLHSHTVNDPLGAEALNTILRFLRAGVYLTAALNRIFRVLFCETETHSLTVFLRVFLSGSFDK